MPLILLPAVDVVDGRAVRLVQGKAGSETEYGSALDAALGWQRDGADWIHLVDLDAAFGRGSNAGLLADVVGRLDVAVELSGGIRDDVSLAAALATGCARVNIGTAALERPEWVRAVIGEFGEKVAVGLDVRGDRLAARGWTQEGGDLGKTLARLDADGCSRFVVTDAEDIQRDAVGAGGRLQPGGGRGRLRVRSRLHLGRRRGGRARGRRGRADHPGDRQRGGGPGTPRGGPGRRGAHPDVRHRHLPLAGVRPRAWRRVR